jgi:hypothetical protein
MAVFGARGSERLSQPAGSAGENAAIVGATMRLMAITLTVGCLLTVARAQVSSIDREQDVQFFPSFGYRVDNGQAWEVEIHGWVYERGHRAELLGLLLRALGIDADELDPAGRALLVERATWFLVDNESRERVVVRVGEAGHAGEQIVSCERSRANGHFTGHARVPAWAPANTATALSTSPDTAPAPATQTATAPALTAAMPTLPLHVLLRRGDARQFTGEVELIDEVGISVISDIDDTLKISEVTDKKSLLRNTFLRPYAAVPGMADVLAAWAKPGGVSFHDVSASPWQLYAPLSSFFKAAGFPRGTFHLKTFRWKDESFFNLFQSPEVYKPPVIEDLLGKFPRRQFVLVGDSGEKDPEIYAALARKHPQQIVRIFIRDIGPPGANDARFRQVFDGLPAELWQAFREAQELPGRLP